VLRTTMALVALRRPDERTKALGETISELLSLDAPRKRIAAEMAGLDICYDFGDANPEDKHPLVGRRMPDLDLRTANGALRVFSLMRDARPLLLQFAASGGIDAADGSARAGGSNTAGSTDTPVGAGAAGSTDSAAGLGTAGSTDSAVRSGAADGPGALGGFDPTPWANRVQLVAATCNGTWELPVLGQVPAPTAVLIRPDGHVAWVGSGTSVGLADALTKWFGHSLAA
jgi:3-(3-hydroxy-phenyl)propionate hydroxylase